jgi:hypothetical protein
MRRGRTVYDPKGESALQQAAGADRVFSFNHTRWCRIAGVEDGHTGVRKPATGSSATSSSRPGGDVRPDEAGRATLWSSSCGFPSAVRCRLPGWPWPTPAASAASIWSRFIRPHRVGETYRILYNPVRRWYAPEMHVNEAPLEVFRFLLATTQFLPQLVQQDFGYIATCAVLSPGGVVTMAMMFVVGRLAATVQSKYLIGRCGSHRDLYVRHDQRLRAPRFLAYGTLRSRMLLGVGLPLIFVPIMAASYDGIPQSKTNQPQP